MDQVTGFRVMSLADVIKRIDQGDIPFIHESINIEARGITFRGLANLFQILISANNATRNASFIVFDCKLAQTPSGSILERGSLCKYHKNRLKLDAKDFGNRIVFASEEHDNTIHRHFS